MKYVLVILVAFTSVAGNAAEKIKINKVSFTGLEQATWVKSESPAKVGQPGLFFGPGFLRTPSKQVEIHPSIAYWLSHASPVPQANQAAAFDLDFQVTSENASVEDSAKELSENTLILFQLARYIANYQNSDCPQITPDSLKELEPLPLTGTSITRPYPAFPVEDPLPPGRLVKALQSQILAPGVVRRTPFARLIAWGLNGFDPKFWSPTEPEITVSVFQSDSNVEIKFGKKNADGSWDSRDYTVSASDNKITCTNYKGNKAAPVPAVKEKPKKAKGAQSARSLSPPPPSGEKDDDPANWD